MASLKQYGIAARATAALIVLAGTMTAQPAATRVNVDAKVLKNAGTAKDTLAGDWLSYGRTQGETRYSPLKQIDTSNVSRLGLSWTYTLGAGGGNQEGTPLVWNNTHLRHHELERGVRPRCPHRQGTVALGPGSESAGGAPEDLLRHREPRPRASTTARSSRPSSTAVWLRSMRSPAR